MYSEYMTGNNQICSMRSSSWYSQGSIFDSDLKNKKSSEEGSVKQNSELCFFTKLQKKGYFGGEDMGRTS